MIEDELFRLERKIEDAERNFDILKDDIKTCLEKTDSYKSFRNCMKYEFSMDA